MIIFIILFIIFLLIELLIKNKKNIKCNNSFRIEGLHEDSQEYDTKRIGNLIDAWFAASLGSKERENQFKLIQNKSGRKSFGKSLFLLPPSEIAPTMSSDEKSKYVTESDIFWALYKYSNIMIAHRDLGMSLRKALHNYQIGDYKRYIPYYDVVIHYRVGDFLNQHKIIDPMDIVNVYANLNLPYNTSVCILDGGIAFNTNNVLREKSTKLMQMLKSGISKYTNKVINTNNKPDVDFMICANAPVLITGAGSFAVAAAIANDQGIIRTPACKNLNFPVHGKIDVFELRPNWQIYDFEYIETSQL